MMTIASAAALLAAAPAATAGETSDAGDTAVLPEATRGEAWSPAQDGNALGARGGRKRARKQYDDDDDSWFYSTGTNRFVGRFYDLGVFTGFGGPVAAPGLQDGVGLTGVRVMENHGYLSKILVVTMMAMGMRDKAYVGSSYSTDSYGNTWRTDYYRSLTPEERAAQEQALSSAVNAEYLMELNVYTRGLWGFSPGTNKAAGFEYYLGGETVIARGRMPTILQIAGAFSWLWVRDAVFKPGEGPRGDQHPNEVHVDGYDYVNVGVMLRALIPVNEWIETFVQWDINVISFFDLTGKKYKSDGNLYASPLRVGALVNLTDRFYAKANGSVNVLGGFGLGWGAELGVRF
jgi:hypothetical protein